MTLTMRLNDLLATVRDQQLAFPAALSEADRAQIGTAESWSARDVLAHNMEWANRTLSEVERIAAGETVPRPDYGDFEAENRAIFERHESKSWAELLTWIEDTYALAAGFVEHSGEEQLLHHQDGRPFPIWRELAGNFITHPMIHLWEYYQQHGYDHLLAQQFDDAFFARLIALHDDPGWQGTTTYNLACRYALAGDHERAMAHLGRALELAPALREWAAQDSDLDALRDEPGYQALFAS